MVTEVVTGVSWYDNFGDATLGAHTPAGWTLYGNSPVTPVAVADPSAMGGKYLSMDGLTAMGMNIAGSPDNFEILVRLRSEDTCSQGQNSLFGGPGGRISVSGSILQGVCLAGTNPLSTTLCGFFCQLSRDNPLWEPPLPVHFRSNLYIKTRDSGETDADSDPWQAYGRGRAYWPNSGKTAGETTDGQPGPDDVTYYWGYMRLRVNALVSGLPASRVRAKWWKSSADEPTLWAEDTEIANIFWPDIAGPVGIIILDESACGKKTFIDYVAVSIDPENTEAPSPTAPRITDRCPLPNGYLGEAYSFQLTAEGI